MSTDYFSSLIQRRFNITLAKAGPKVNHARRFVMDNDSCQTRNSLFMLNEIGGELHRIPARLPDLNPIENIFNIIKKKLAKEALNIQIEKDHFRNSSLPKRIYAVLKGRGCQTKY